MKTNIGERRIRSQLGSAKFWSNRHSEIIEMKDFAEEELHGLQYTSKSKQKDQLSRGTEEFPEDNKLCKIHGTVPISLRMWWEGIFSMCSSAIFSLDLVCLMWSYYNLDLP